MTKRPSVLRKFMFLMESVWRSAGQHGPSPAFTALLVRTKAAEVLTVHVRARFPAGIC